MYIEEIIIDGFKSYSTRTVISGFDPKFNAITGLNGSGKSNILDAICFVLGISNLSQVRVSNLQELVYKQGQAGISKASVTIIFNNDAREQSPIGYEQYDKITVCRQIVIGGRNKYLINGHTAQLNQVQTLFHSVQLNVNNPHFLIMQGRITKVLNMKPIEILGMIEEAAGTKMYEINRQKSVATIEKKEIKVLEINRILKEEITPTLVKLEEQKKEYLKWRGNQTEYDSIKRLLTVNEYMTQKQKLITSEEQIKKQKEEENEYRTDQNSKRDKLRDIEVNISRLTSSIQNEMSNEILALSEKEKEESKNLVKLSTKIENLKKLISDDTRENDKVNAAIKQLQEQHEILEQTIITKSQEYEEIKKAKVHWEKVQNSLQLSGGNQIQMIQQTITQLQTNLSNSNLELQNYLLKLNNINQQKIEIEKELKQLEVYQNQFKQSENNLLFEYDNIQRQLNQAKEQYSFLQNAENQIKSLNSQKQKLNSQLNQMTNQFQGYNFSYSKPTSNFDSSRVHGVIFRLFHAKNREMNLALETIAGGKLYQIVVDNPETGKQLLQRGNLKQRFTFIPIQGIQHNVMQSDTIRLSKQIVGEDNIHLALDLIVFDEYLRPAMEYIFGNTFVCSNPNDAKTIAFHRDIYKRCVTKDGDSYEPSGTIQGGSAPQNVSVLDRMTEIIIKENEISSIDDSIIKYEREISDISIVKNTYKRLTEEIEVKRHELENQKQKNEKTSYSSLISKYNEIEEKQNEMIMSKDQKEKEINKISQEIFEYGEELKKLAKVGDDIPFDISDYKSKIKEINTKFRSIENTFETSQLEKKEIDKEMKQNKEIAINFQVQLEQNIRDLNDLEIKFNTSSEEYKTIKGELHEKQLNLSSSNTEIKNSMKLKEEIERSIANIDLKLKKLSFKFSKNQSDFEANQKIVQELLKENNWVLSEELIYNQQNSVYQNNKKSIDQLKQRLNEISNEQEMIERKINKKVLIMIERASDDYKELTKKKRQLEEDKTSIQKAIEDLDRKKIEALDTTFLKVNKDFSSIFSTLLPNSSSILEKIDSNDISKGVEVKVSFSGKFKDSLTELSGGQRSLLALSLVLAMLLYKPAPMYILDEVDAALDLSHTQNIGTMLRQHFNHSQFIVVSLKEGMFNNANVVFRTKFVDGISTVTRTMNRTN